MSDFLTHLAARAVAPAVSVRPKLASLFELPPATGTLHEARVVGLETSEEVASDRDRVHDSQGGTPNRSKSSEAELGGKPVHTEPASANSFSALASQLLSVTDARSQSDERPPASLAPRSSRREEAHSSSEPSQKLQPSVANPIIHSATQHLPASPSPTIPNQPKTTSQPHTEATPFQPLLVPPRRDGRAPEPLRPAPSAHVTPRAPVSKADALAPPPAIQVTIGRLEIRAVAPPATQARPQSTRAPVVSLEDYLRQRASGGGR